MERKLFEMVNKHLFYYEVETEVPQYGILLADHFCETYGFRGHRSKGTKDWLMIYTVSGEGSFRVNQEIQTCRKNDVAILSPGIPHHYAANEGSDWDLLWVHFLPLPEWKDLLQLPRTAEQLIHLSVNEETTRGRMEQAFYRLIADSRKAGKTNHDLAILSLTEILLLLHQIEQRQFSDEEEMTHLDERIEQSIQYMSGNLQHKHSLSELSQQAGLSESRFCHLFKEQTSATYTEFLTKLRLQRAVKLLQLTTRQVKEIAADVGFESAYYFTRRFTNHYGVSPSLYRQQIQQENRLPSIPMPMDS